jgi:hypothetical protein
LNWQKSDGCRDVLLRARNNALHSSKQHGRCDAVDHHTGRWRNHNNSKKEKDCAEQINTGEALAQRFEPAARKNASYIERLHKFLMQQQRIDITPHYRAVNELRLLNNAVKHAGRVTAELAREYPRWKQGRKLTGVGAAYERLRRPVPSYILLNVLNWGSNNASL